MNVVRSKGLSFCREVYAHTFERTKFEDMQSSLLVRSNPSLVFGLCTSYSSALSQKWTRREGSRHQILGLLQRLCVWLMMKTQERLMYCVNSMIIIPCDECEYVKYVHQCTLCGSDVL